MTSDLQPIKVWGKGGPNPPKVAMILGELGLPHEIIPISFPDLKKPDFLAINPNGRMPAIQDPNTGITLWESGAIIEYLIETYDKDHRKLSFPPGSADAWHAKQWLFFQTTGQGPYYGQAVWFKKFHPENLPSAYERYVKEIARVTSVLEGHLSSKKEKSQEGPWLVGDKLSYADLAFIPWQNAIGMNFPKEDYDVKKYPLVNEWLEKMMGRPVIKQVLEDSAH